MNENKTAVWLAIRSAIKDRLLRMGLIKNSEKAHGHALDLLADDVMQAIKPKYREADNYAGMEKDI